MYKPIIDWLNTLPKGYRELALENYTYEKKEAFNMPSALINAFDWKTTRQGYMFWDAVCTHYETGANLPKIK